MDPVLIYNSKDYMESEMIKAMLKDNGIACIVTVQNNSVYPVAYHGYSPNGAGIYVNPQEAERAVELIQEVVGSKDEQATEEEEGSINKIRLRRRVVSCVILVFAAATALVGIVATILGM